MEAERVEAHIAELKDQQGIILQLLAESSNPEVRAEYETILESIQWQLGKFRNLLHRLKERLDHGDRKFHGSSLNQTGQAAVRGEAPQDHTEKCVR